MQIITGFTGTNHITAEMDRDVNIGILGPQSYVLSVGKKIESEVASNNEIKISDGVIVHQGCAGVIKKNTYDSVTIMNGSQGMKRVDLIVLRYERNQDTGVESLGLEVMQGTPAESDPVIPEYIEGDIQAGDLVADMPLYKVELDGINIVAVEPLFQVLMDMSTLNAYLSDLINETTTVEYDKTVINFTSAWSTRHCEVYKTGRIVQLSARIYSGTILKDHEYTIANVNTEFRPAHETPIYAVAGDVYMQNLVPCMCSIQPSGKILFKASGEQKQYVDIAGTYIV